MITGDCTIVCFHFALQQGPHTCFGSKKRRTPEQWNLSEFEQQRLMCLACFRRVPRVFIHKTEPPSSGEKSTVRVFTVFVLLERYVDLFIYYL
jgi:hypothetical protein